MPSVRQKRHPKQKHPEPFDRMLRRFKKQCDRAGIVQECRKREFYLKPSAKRNEKNNQIKRKRKLEKERIKQEGYRHKGFWW
jgi:small subunit ribosomal protein S21